MRPSVLNPLFASVAALAGVGVRQEKLYAKLLGRDGPRLIDLLFHLPTGAIDRRASPRLADVVPGSLVTVAVRIERHRPPPPHRSRSPYLIYASDDTGDLVITYFNMQRSYLQRLLPVGELRYVSGTTGLYDGMLQMVHPDRVVDEKGLADLPRIEPVYPLTEGLAHGQVYRAVEAALAKLPPLPEWQDEAWLARQRWPSFADALRKLHRPAEPTEVVPETPHWSRLAFDELLGGQLALALTRAHMRRQPGRARASPGRLRQKIAQALPYALTPSQRRAIEEIAADLEKPQRMLRLLQGDVGSGKTVVALLAAAHVIEAGGQAALMAPTEILARQHLHTIAPLAEAAGIRVAILTGRERGRERAQVLDGLAAGDLDLLVGTHALFQEEVAFRDLALAAAEQRFRELKQRFGEVADLVHGRLKGADKDAAMARFAAGQARLLVATTVIEVGVDVPEATVMVIEHAERFGLAQLHQLRGRIGRGSEHSSCLLLYRGPLGETAKARLNIMRETEDGFRIAEEDLRLRGEGDVLGTRQSGMPGFRIARIESHGKLIGAARDDASLLLARDPNLASERGQALRHLLYLFERDEAIRLIRAG